MTSPAHVVTGFDIRKFRKFKPKFLVEWNARTGSRPFPLPIIPRAPSQTQYYSKLSHREPLRRRGGWRFISSLHSPDESQQGRHSCPLLRSCFIGSCHVRFSNRLSRSIGLAVYYFSQLARFVLKMSEISFHFPWVFPVVSKSKITSGIKP